MKILTRIWRLLEPSERRKFVALQMLSVFMALSAVGGIAAVVPFFSVLADPNSIDRNAALQALYRHLHFASRDSFVFALGAVFVALVLLANGVNLFGMVVINRFALRVSDSLFARLFAGYLRRDFGFHLRTNSADLASKLLHDSGRVSNGVLRQGLILVSNAVTVLFIMASLVLVNPLVAVGATVGLGAGYAAVYAITRGLLLRNGRSQGIYQAARTRLVTESLGAIREVTILDAQDFFVQRFAHYSRSYSRIELSTLAVSATPRSILECALVCCLVGGALYLRSGSDGVGPWLGQLSFIGLAAYRLLPALQQAFVAIVSIRANHIALEDIAAELQQTSGGADITHFDYSDRTWRAGPHCEIRLHDVSYRYTADRPPAIASCSLSIPIGSTVGFVGANGSGKSTLIDVLAGLLTPTSGRVEIDGVALDHTNRRAWHAAIAYVPQQVFLLDASIAENIALGVPPERIDRERLSLVIDLAHLTECVAALPNGYEEVIGDRGCRLSGGQRQRLGIARALYREASVLILDEATSALDNAAEEEIISALHELQPRRTLLLIAHRLSALRHCDVIHELRNGRIARSGNYADLQSAAVRTRTIA